MTSLLRSARWAAASVALASLLATGVVGTSWSSPSGAAPSRTHAPQPRVMPVGACKSSGLVEWLNTQQNGTAGTIFYHLEFTNLSGNTCTLRGYPGVSGITLGGVQLGSAAQRTAGMPVRTVTLAPGKTATAVLGIVIVGNYPPSACRATTAAGLRIYAPNQTAAKTSPFPFGACTRAGPRYLTIQAVKLA